MKNILCYGDSNTYGAKPLEFNFLDAPFTLAEIRYEKSVRWTGIMEQELGKEYSVIEEGLGGRTTVWDDPVEGEYKNGFKYLPACLESHAPLDLVIIMLGTNDLKVRFSISALDIALGAGVLIDLVKKSGCGPDGKQPQVLVVCPPPLGKLTYFSDLFGGETGIEKSRQLAEVFKKIANLYNCQFLDAGKIIKPSKIDGVHYDPESLKILGKKMAEVVKKIIG